MMELPFLSALFIAHVLGDFYFQPSHWVSDKREHKAGSVYLYFHAATHFGLALLVALLFLPDSYSMVLLLSAAIGISHYMIDLGKSYLSTHVRYFVLDQLLHVLIILLLWLIVTEQLEDLPYLLNAMDGFSFAIIVLSFLIVVKPAAIFIAMLLTPLVSKIDREDEGNSNDSLENAGKMIGICERVIVLTLILLQQYAAIGFILAAKSVFRFGDLRDASSRSRTEYVLLGTFLSLAVVLVIGLLALFALRWN